MINRPYQVNERGTLTTLAFMRRTVRVKRFLSAESRQPAVLRSRYERLPDFVALAKKLDPYGQLRTKFLNQNIFA
jgi:hypothetical protein